MKKILILTSFLILGNANFCDEPRTSHYELSEYESENSAKSLNFLSQDVFDDSIQKTENKNDFGTVEIPVIMYHSIWDQASGDFIITPDQFENDLKYLKQEGYESVTLSQVEQFVNLNGTPYAEGILPKKPVLLTFDDGQLNNITVAEPLMKKYGFKGVLFIVGSYCDMEEQSIKGGHPRSGKYSCLTWDEVRTASESGIWEIGSHTYNFHENSQIGVSRKKGETETQYRMRLSEDFRAINSKIKQVTGKSPCAFAYPFGRIDPIAKQVLIETGTEMLFTCADGISEINNRISLNSIKRVLRLSGTNIHEKL